MHRYFVGLTYSWVCLPKAQRRIHHTAQILIYVSAFAIKTQFCERLERVAVSRRCESSATEDAVSLEITLPAGRASLSSTDSCQYKADPSLPFAPRGVTQPSLHFDTPLPRRCPLNASPPPCRDDAGPRPGPASHRTHLPPQPEEAPHPGMGKGGGGEVSARAPQPGAASRIAPPEPLRLSPLP